MSLVLFFSSCKKKVKIVYEFSDLRARKSRLETDWCIVLGRKKSQP